MSISSSSHPSERSVAPTSDLLLSPAYKYSPLGFGAASADEGGTGGKISALESSLSVHLSLRFLYDESCRFDFMGEDFSSGSVLVVTRIAGDTMSSTSDGGKGSVIATCPLSGELNVHSVAWEPSHAPFPCVSGTVGAAPPLPLQLYIGCR